MATENKVLDVSKAAAEDLSSYQYHIVVLDATAGTVRLPNAATDVPFGILQNAPASGEAAVVRPIGCGGISKVVANAALAIGAFVGMEYVGAADAGKGQALVPTQYPVGVVLEASSAEDELASVLLTPLVSLLKTGGTTSAADSLAIPVTHAYVAKTTGADAEALTLADGTPGQILTLALVVDGGGTGTLTPTTKSGFATIVFADAGDIAALQFVDATTGWVILGTAGVAAPPVITI